MRRRVYEKLFIFMHHFSPWHSSSKLDSAHMAYRNGWCRVYLNVSKCVQRVAVVVVVIVGGDLFLYVVWA